MERKMPFRRRPTLPYRDFVEKVNRCRWEEATAEQLKSRLKKMRHSNRAACYSLLKEVIRRIKGVRLFDSQLSAAYCMEQGEIAELPTGEGKTLAAAVTAVSLALQGRRVHILVFNDYLAERDFMNNREIFDFCGLSSGCILHGTPTARRREAYRKDILYITAKEAGYDDLKNFVVQEKANLLQLTFDVALVDEADSILIDEAGKPLVIAGAAEEKSEPLSRLFGIKNRLAAEDLEVKNETRQVWLTEQGIAHVEDLLGLKNLYAPENAEYLAYLHVMLEAEHFYKRDRDYIIKSGQVCPVDENTGRIAKDRKFPDYLHKAIEQKEGLHAGAGTAVFNTMPLQFFVLKYRTLCGMTGTAWISRKEIKSMYGLRVRRIPPHRPCLRNDHKDLVFATAQQHQNAVIQKIKEVNGRGQPILVGTQSVGESQQYAALLEKDGLKCSVLNAKQDEREAELIARAGEPYRITISTNMAGRGVDIAIDAASKKAGGLFILGTGINRSRRIDEQIRGRAGRQGDPGESQFFISWQQTRIQECMGRQKKTKDGLSIQSLRSIMEGEDAQSRYILEKYSVILEKQRRIISEYRESVLKRPKEIQFLKDKSPDLYEQKLCEVSLTGLLRAQQQLLLYFINRCWANYLLTMETVREGIHLAVIGGEDPLAVYQKFAARAFLDMEQHIEREVLSKLGTSKLTEHGIDMDGENLRFATSTQTYLIDESKSQFARRRLDSMQNI